MRKEKGFSLAKMTFFKDFINDKRGDLYPILASEGEFSERIGEGKYHFSAESEGAYSVRLFCRHFPYATYSISPELIDGRCGISLLYDGKRYDILFFESEGKLCAGYGDSTLNSGIAMSDTKALLVSARQNKFDIYADIGSSIELIGTFTIPELEDIAYSRVFTKTAVGVYTSGKVIIKSAESYMDTGISQADIRPIRYEDGEIMTEGGRIFLTVSVRLEEWCYQGVFSWLPGTAELSLTGALFFDAGDGLYANDVASSIIYHRPTAQWYIWVCSFAHDHILGHAVAEGDVRFGINAIDLTLMEKMKEGDGDDAFLGKWGDEDPDFIYDEKERKWRMTVCRLVKIDGINSYRYHYFESDSPFENYRFVARAESGNETGGSIVKIDGDYYFVCGSGLERANYRCYSLPEMKSFTPLAYDYDDGGFRGWGTIIPIKAGTRTRYYQLTFDRHLGSSYNWSYGNIYCYLLDEEKV